MHRRNRYTVGIDPDPDSDPDTDGNQEQTDRQEPTPGGLTKSAAASVRSQKYQTLYLPKSSGESFSRYSAHFLPSSL
jgi:hypothetical protein